MFAGVGIIGALASILASLLVPPPKQDDKDAEAAAGASASAPAASGPSGDAVAGELANLRAEVAALRAAIEAGRT
jgi:hypothetical protein